MGTKRILGVDRALMMLCKQARKYWRFYSPIYKAVKALSTCSVCANGKKLSYVEVDHEPPLGSRPQAIEELPDWWNRMMYGPQTGLCKKHHTEKTKHERTMRKLRKGDL